MHSVSVYAFVVAACYNGRISLALVPVVPPSSTDLARIVAKPSDLALYPTTQSAASFSPMQSGISSWLVAAAAATETTPSTQDIALLRQAFAVFYNQRNDASLKEAESLLTQVIERWQNQPADERAGIYRVRGDCYLALANAPQALDDYTQALSLLPSGAATDPVELSAASLGRARAAKSIVVATKLSGGETNRVRQLSAQSAKDYETALMYLTRNNDAYDDDDDSTPQDRIEEGVLRNPYVAWEWGDALRLSGKYTEAAKARSLASFAFGTIGDKARSVMALTDAGIDYASVASSESTATAIAVLRDAIQRAPGIESRDVGLLQRVIEKEGEGRMALAALLWTDAVPQRNEAERILGDACLRLDQLTLDKMSRGGGGAQGTVASASPQLRYTMDDDERGVVGSVACYKFKNPQFLTEKLGWPESLQRKVIQLETLR